MIHLASLLLIPWVTARSTRDPPSHAGRDGEQRRTNSPEPCCAIAIDCKLLAVRPSNHSASYAQNAPMTRVILRYLRPNSKHAARS